MSLVRWTWRRSPAGRLGLVGRQHLDSHKTLLRERLLAAARAGRLPFQDGALVDVFVEDGKSAATAIELEALDDK